MFLCGQEGKWHCGLHYEQCGQQVEGGYSPPLLCPGEAASGVLCPVLRSPIQQRQGTTGKGPAEGYKDVWETGTSLSLRQAEGAGCVQAGEETTERGSYK